MVLFSVSFLFLCGIFCFGFGSDIDMRSANGELAQFEYAGKAVLRNKDFAVSFVHPELNCAVALSVCKVQSPLMISLNKAIQQYPSSKIASTTVGYPPDCHLVSKSMNEFIQDYVQLYGDEPSLVYLSNKVSELMISGMIRSGEIPLTRPLAAVSLLLQHDDSCGRPMLYQVDSSGSVSDRLYSIFGDFTPTTYKSVESIIQQLQKGSVDEDDSHLTRLYETLCEIHEDEDQLYNVELCVVSKQAVKRWARNSIDKNFFKRSEHALMWKNLYPALK